MDGEGVVFIIVRAVVMDEDNEDFYNYVISESQPFGLV